MSGICGWFAPLASGVVDTAVIRSMADVLGRFDGTRYATVAASFGALAVAAPEGAAHLHAGERSLAALWGRPRYTEAELAGIAQRHGHARALAEGYERCGVEVLRQIAGPFAAVVLDGDKRTALLATDRMGIHPLCHADAPGALVFASTLDAISVFPGITTSLDRQAIYDYVHFHMVPGPRTIYAGRTRLLPGTCLEWRPGVAAPMPYWEMRYVEDERHPFAELREAFLARLRDAVRIATAEGEVGAFLSGGTDSSTVAGVLTQVTGEPARTYSIGFEARGYDEMSYARIAARHFGTRHHEYYVTPEDVVAAIPRIAAIHDQPFGNSSAVPTYFCARLAREDGVAALLGGDGGDELFGGNERYATQYLYSLYSDLPGFARKGLIEPLAFLLPEAGLVGKAQRYMRNASIPMPARYDHYNLLERLGPENVFTPEFLAGVNRTEPANRMAEAYGAARARALVNRMLALDLRYTLADNDLPKVSRSCELAGVEARYPLLDDTVVAFSARLEPRWKLRGTKLRWFFKEALRGFLPEEIITKTKHGFGLPFGPWLQAHEPLKRMALESLDGLRSRGIVRRQFLDELTTIHVREHAAYYGTMVWVLMMLEQWLRCHSAR